MYQTDVPLAPFSTLNVGGTASRYIAIEDVEQLQSVIQKNSLPIFILGGGSNILLPDEGWRGLVTHMQITGITWDDIGDTVRVTAGAGVEWDHLVGESVQRGLYGLENLSLIPGTVGAAPIQNIGAYGAEVADVIETVHVVHKKTGERRTFTASECIFGYRTSFFKTGEGRNWIITRVSFLLEKRGVLDTSYADVEAYLDTQKIQNPTLADLRSAVIAIRKSKLPDLSIYGTAGSFFKNPVITAHHYDDLRAMYPNIPGYEAAGGIKVPLAWILDHILDLKGYSQGAVGLYTNQPLVLITRTGATASAVNALALYVEERVRKKTGISVEREVTAV